MIGFEQELNQKMMVFLAVLQQNENYQLLQQTQNLMENDEKIQKLILDFEQAKSNFEEAQRFGKYHPDYATYRRELAQAKKSLDQEPLVQKYKQSHKSVQALLNQLSIRLGTAISKHIIVPSDYFGATVTTKKSCGSGCKCSS